MPGYTITFKENRHITSGEKPTVMVDGREMILLDPQSDSDAERLAKALAQHKRCNWDAMSGGGKRGLLVEAGCYLNALAATPPKEVYQHIVVSAKNNMATSLCGKKWELGEQDVTVIGRCPDCKINATAWAH